MPVKYEMETSIAVLLMQRLGAEKLRGEAADAKLWNEHDKADQIIANLGKEIRRRLREIGYEKDCEIDAEMEDLARVLRDAHEELSFYIYKNSPVMADKLAKLGITNLREWQDTHPSAIRPDRRH